MSVASPVKPQDIPHLTIMARRIKRKRGELPWREWLERYFSAFTSAPFAQHHIDLWEWAASIEGSESVRPFIACWPRGGAKSTTVELAATWLGSQPQPVRNYVLYVSETQAQADKHVQAIAGMLERVGISRAVNEYGASKGWRRTEVRASNGFNVTAMGLDSAMRGAKLDEFRPDMIVFDDIDGRHDSPNTVTKKIEVITDNILPAGSTDVAPAVIVVQNMIHEHSIMAKLLDGTADFLLDRLPAEPIPAVRDLQTEKYTDTDGQVMYRVVGGEPTWEGQNLKRVERQINTWGIGAFEREAQHNVAAVDGGLWSLERDINPFRVQTVPDLDRIVVAIDPNAGGADEAGIVVAGIANQIYDASLRSFRIVDRPHGYVLEDVTTSGGSKNWAEAAVAAYHKYRADALIAEKNNGGDMVAITIGTVDAAPPVELVWASRGKLTRAEPVQKLYADGRVHHVGTLPELERELATWKPGPKSPSPNRLDALVWALTELMIEEDGDYSDLDDYYSHQFGGR